MKSRVALLLLTLSLLAFTTPVAASILWADAPIMPFLARDTVLEYQAEGIPYYVYLPSSAPLSKPLTPLLAIHGYGDNARGFATHLIATANHYGWLLVVPDLPSGDWKDFQVIKADSRRNLPWLHNLVHSLPGVMGVPVEDRALVYGFSLGAQTGHRFALAYPEDVRAAAVMSAGTYTLPMTSSPNTGDALSFPLGTADLGNYCERPFDPGRLRVTHFWVGVGESDSIAADVPREFDNSVGDCRRDRALSFARSLWDQGVPAEFQTFPDQAHWETPASLEAATGFLFRVHSLQE